ncbi:MAG: hypothetical protein AB1942_05250 [Pseudomonadota bacterium]
MATGSRSVRSRGTVRGRRFLALLLSVLAHVVALGGFVLKRAAGDLEANPPTVHVELVRLAPMPRPTNAPTSPAPAAAPARDADEPSATTPTGPASRDSSGPGPGVDPRWAVDLNGPVFADGRWPRPRIVGRCDPLRDPKRESVACRREDAVARGVTRANDPRNGTDEFAREARHNEAVRRYHELPGTAGYPGIGCHIFHRC